MVLEKKCESSSTKNECEIKHLNSRGYTVRTSYRKLKERVRTIRDDATEKSRADWVQRRAKEIEEHISLSDLDDEQKEMIFEKLAENQDFVLPKNGLT